MASSFSSHPPADKSRQQRDRCDNFVAVDTDLSSRSPRMLLRMLRRALRARLRDATPSWLSASHTARAIRKRPCCIRSSRNNWKLSSPDNRSATVRSPGLLKRNSVPFWIAAFSRGVFCGFTAPTVDGIGCCRSPVKRASGVRRVVDDACRIQRRISSIVSFQSCRCGSGSCRWLLRSAIAWPTNGASPAMSSTFSYAFYLENCGGGLSNCWVWVPQSVAP